MFTDFLKLCLNYFYQFAYFWYIFINAALIISAYAFFSTIKKRKYIDLNGGITKWQIVMSVDSSFITDKMVV